MRRSIFASATLVLGLTAGFFWTSCEKEADVVSQARDLIENDRLDEALALLEKEREANGLDARLALGIGWIYETQGEPARAVSLYRDALKVAPSAEINMRMASIFLALEQTQAALAQYEKAREAGATDAEVALPMAVTLGRLQRFEDARNELLKAEAAEAPAASIHYNRGLLLRIEGRTADSHAEFLAAAEADAQDHNALRELARTELLLAPNDPGAAERASEYINQSLTLSEASENLDWRAYEVLGDCFMIQGDWQAGSQMFLKAKEIGLDPVERLDDKYYTAQIKLRDELGMSIPPDAVPPTEDGEE